MRVTRKTGAVGGTALIAVLSACVLVHEEREVQSRAAGTFEVQTASEASDAHPEGLALGRSSLDKRFHGDLDGRAHGEMLTAMTATDGSAGYVAIERVEGSLHGRSGSFVLQHSGLMTRGSPSLLISVVPDSGTGELTGLTGTMRIIIDDGGHAYEFDYSFEEPAGR